jgi:hypothetical protein
MLKPLQKLVIDQQCTLARGADLEFQGHPGCSLHWKIASGVRSPAASASEAILEADKVEVTSQLDQKVPDLEQKARSRSASLCPAGRSTNFTVF